VVPQHEELRRDRDEPEGGREQEREGDGSQTFLLRELLLVPAGRSSRGRMASPGRARDGGAARRLAAGVLRNGAVSRCNAFAEPSRRRAGIATGAA
jgi:hypothetical protein